MGYRNNLLTLVLVVFATGDGNVFSATTEAWVRRYNGPANGDDTAQAVAMGKNGNVMVTGSSYNGTNNDFYTAKYALANGALLWENHYNGPANNHDAPIGVAVDDSGNVLITGSSFNESGHSDYYTAKYAATDGALLWEKRYRSAVNNHNYPKAIAVDGNGDVVVTGASFNGNNNDYYTAKYAAANGALRWERRYNGPANNGDSPIAVAVDGSGNVVVTGTSDNATNSDYYTAKYAAANGVLLWEKRYNGPANFADQAQALAVDRSGNVIVTGLSLGRSGFDYSYDYYTAKYSATDGALLWEQRYNGPANYDDFAQAVAVDGSGNVVVTGRSFNGNDDDYYTAKYAAANGELLWEQRYDGPRHDYDSAQAVAVDSNGNVVVTGGSQGDFYTVKYAATDGTVLWEERYNGPANRSDFVAGSSSLSLGSNGIVVITGSSQNTSNFRTTFDYATLAYQESPLRIIEEPSDQTGAAGSALVLQVGVEGTRPLNYKWRRNGSAIPGANDNQLLFTNITTAEAGSYDVIVSGSQGSVTSAVANVVVGYSLAIHVFGSGSVTAFPSQVIYLPGESVVLNATANAGSEFWGWTAPVVTTKDALSLTLTSNSTVTAVFTNRVLSAAHGDYAGLFIGAEGWNRTNSGLLTATLTPLGRLRGAVRMEQRSYNFVGTFPKTGDRVSEIRFAGPAKSQFTWICELTPNGLRGRLISTAGLEANVEADATLRRWQPGKLPAKFVSPEGTASATGMVTLTRSGRVVWMGRVLPEAASFLFAGPITRGGRCPVYQRIPLRGSVETRVLAGWLEFETSGIAGELYYFDSSHTRRLAPPN